MLILRKSPYGVVSGGRPNARNGVMRLMSPRL